MNRIEAMTQLGNDLDVSPVPDTISGLVSMLGGTRAAAGLIPGEAKVSSKQRTLQRYLRAERGETGKNVRGQSAEKRSAFTDALRQAVIDAQCAAVRAKHPHGFRAKVKGKFFYSYAQAGRSVVAVTIPRADMDNIVELIQDDEYAKAADLFDRAFAASYAPDGSLDDMRWGEDDADPDAFDSLTIS
jgi:hypothetical protein